MSEISIIVHDPVPDDVPITAEEIRESLDALGYHVRHAIVRNDYAPPCFLVRRDIGKHLGPFSSRLDAVTALDLIPTAASAWEILGDEEFETYLDLRAERGLA